MNSEKNGPNMREVLETLLEGAKDLVGLDESTEDAVTREQPVLSEQPVVKVPLTLQEAFNKIDRQAHDAKTIERKKREIAFEYYSTALQIALKSPEIVQALVDFTREYYIHRRELSSTAVLNVESLSNIVTSDRYDISGILDITDTTGAPAVQFSVGLNGIYNYFQVVSIHCDIERWDVINEKQALKPIFPISSPLKRVDFNDFNPEFLRNWILVYIKQMIFVSMVRNRAK